MASYRIIGGHPLSGKIKIDGMKNAAVAMMIAGILVEDVCVLENVPLIQDVIVTIEILRQMGVKVEWLSKDVLSLDSRIATSGVTDELVRKMRASYYLLGSELGRFKKSKMAYPGGCNFGLRPVDQHLKGFQALGAKCSLQKNYITVSAEKLYGAEIYFDKISVGATINVMLSAVKAEGVSILHHVAKEPHVGDVAEFLNACGAKISGIGTDTLTIHGVSKLHGCHYRILPDMIEAGTYLIATAAVGGMVVLENVVAQHLDCLCDPLMNAGANITKNENQILIQANPNKMKAFSIKTGPYPMFPTDLQPQIGAMFSCIKGCGSIQETVWDHRFQYCNELKKMGADIECIGNIAYFHDADLHATKVRAVDLRAGAAMVIAGLSIDGETIIEDIHHIERGYGHLLEKFHTLGAKIERIQ